MNETTMPWNQTLTNLRDLLADLYFTVQDSRVVVEQAGLKPKYIAFDNRAITNWQNILRDAAARGKVQAIVAVARQDFPENDWLAFAQDGQLPAVKGPDIGTDLAWEGPGEGSQLEKIIGHHSTLLPVSFLEMGFKRAKSVARVVLANGDTGSGFLTKANLLITNNHVLTSAEAARTATVQFNFQRTATGRDAAVKEFQLNPDELFVTSAKAENDWTAVRVQGNPNARWGALTLQPAKVSVGDRVSIIQHPGGGPKQIAIHRNTVAYAGDTRIQYLTDTLPGSSGSPVFDQQWRVVALHDSGGWLREPGTKQRFYRNEGIHVNAVIEGLRERALA